MRIRYEVWMRAEHDMCDSAFGGMKLGEAYAESWVEACTLVMKAWKDNDEYNYWHESAPTYYWGTPLCTSEEEAFENFSKDHPYHPINRKPDDK